jgi:predicted DNA-binding transcriptional regulator AlpA
MKRSLALASSPAEPDALLCLRAAEAALSDLSADELPAFVADVERLKALIWTRLLRPLPTEDRLISVSQAAAVLSVSEDTIYRGKFPFIRHVGGSVRCSWLGIQRYIRNSS